MCKDTTRQGKRPPEQVRIKQTHFKKRIKLQLKGKERVFLEVSAQGLCTECAQHRRKVCETHAVKNAVKSIGFIYSSLPTGTLEEALCET